MKRENIEKLLQTRRDNNNFREIKNICCRQSVEIDIDGNKYIDFASNDYLSLSNNEELISASMKATKQFGTSSSASRLMSGTNSLHTKLEEKIAEYKGYPSALIFGSGFQANIGLLPSLIHRHDLILADEFIHASLIDGAILSRAKLIRYKHNDMQDLKAKLAGNEGYYQHTTIVSESLFSMDGDIAPIKEMVNLKNEYKAALFIDEAHATGVFGAGIVSELGLQSEVEYLIGTFSKALGSYGGFFLSNNITRDYLINYCRSFIYSTSLPPSALSASIAAIDYCKKNHTTGKEVLNKAAYFREHLKHAGFHVTGESQIVPVIIGKSASALDFTSILQKEGYNVLAVRPPTVPEGSARVRFSICKNHKKADLDSIVEILKRSNAAC